MPPQLIRFHGTYRYDLQEALDQAIAQACAQLEEEDLASPELASLRCFIKRGTSLSVDVMVPAIADVRFAAANVFQTLARDAVEGAVEARHGSDHVDFFPSGGDE